MNGIDARLFDSCVCRLKKECIRCNQKRDIARKERNSIIETLQLRMKKTIGFEKSVFRTVISIIKKRDKDGK